MSFVSPGVCIKEVNTSVKKKLPSFKKENKQCQYCFKKDHYTQHCKVLRHDKKVFLDKQIKIRGIIEETIRENGVIPGAIFEIESLQTATSHETMKDYVMIEEYNLRSSGILSYGKDELYALIGREEKQCNGKYILVPPSEYMVRDRFLGSDNRMEEKPRDLPVDILMRMEPLQSYMILENPEFKSYVEREEDYVVGVKNMQAGNVRCDREIIIYDNTSLSSWGAGETSDLNNLWENFKKDMRTNDRSSLTDGLIASYSFDDAVGWPSLMTNYAKAQAVKMAKHYAQDSYGFSELSVSEKFEQSIEVTDVEECYEEGKMTFKMKLPQPVQHFEVNFEISEDGTTFL